jgi:hypothetical protein
VTLAYQTDQELLNLVDDLLFEVSAEAQMLGCYSETEAHVAYGAVGLALGE